MIMFMWSPPHRIDWKTAKLHREISLHPVREDKEERIINKMIGGERIRG